MLNYKIPVVVCICLTIDTKITKFNKTNKNEKYDIITYLFS